MSGLRRVVYQVGHLIRETGQAMERLGARAQGYFRCAEPLDRHRQLMNIMFERPLISKGVFLAPCAGVVGSVFVGTGSSIWYGAVVRGDDAPVIIGDNTNIQDRVMIVPKDIMRVRDKETKTLVIGNRVTVGHAATINNAVIEDECLIGMGAVISYGAKVCSHAMVAAGSLVPSNVTVPSGELWAGSPAEFKRKLTPEEIEGIKDSAEEYCLLAKAHLADVKKTPDQIAAEKSFDQLKSFDNNVAMAVKELRPDVMS